MGRNLKKKSCSTSGKNRPSFFKVMIGDFDEKLRVPTAFVRHFNGKLPRNSILRSSTGRSWTIRVKKVGHDLFFSNGWHAFVNDHALEFGDFLVFRYNGESKFTVKIYGRSGCEKEVHFNEEPIANTKKEIHKQEPMPNVKKENEALHSFPNLPKAAYVQSHAEEREIKAASAFESENPFCKIIMRKSFVHEPYNLHVPRDFGNEYLKEKTHIVTLQVSNEKTWQVQCCFSGYHTRLYKGWKKFVSDNHLEEGDICVFELVERKNFEIRVSIFRVSQYVENIEDRMQSQEMD